MGDEEVAVIATMPFQAADNSVRSALEIMISETSQQVVYVKKTRPCGWRTRTIIQEIKSLNSFGALEEFEHELRHVLISQETRLRTKLSRQMLSEECLIEEICVLGKEETDDREAIEYEVACTVGIQMNTILLMQAEEHDRMWLHRDYRKLMKTSRIILRQKFMLEKEWATRNHIQQSESLGRAELVQRRIIEVGQEVQMEMNRRNTLSFFVSTLQHSASFLKDMKAIFRAEERDRLNIEKLSFLNLAVYYTEAQSDLCRVLRDDILTVSSRQVASAVEDCKHNSDVQKMIAHETQLRAMITSDYQTRWQSLYADFIIRWRDVYKSIHSHDDFHRIISSVELYERRYIYDEYRYGLNQITDAFDRAHPIALMWERKRARLFDEFVRTVSIIWKEENDAFTTLYHANHYAVSEMRSLESLFVLKLEEERCRRQLLGQEARRCLQLRERMIQDRCITDCLEGVYMIRATETFTWNKMLSSHTQSALIIPMEEIETAESSSRFEIEHDEHLAAVDLLSCSKDILHKGSMFSASADLCAEENVWRARVWTSERLARQALSLDTLVSEEHSRRRTVRGHEAYFRKHLNARILEMSELQCRDGLEQEFHHQRRCIAMASTERLETIARRRIAGMEMERRDFIAGSVPYQQLFLRSCEVDELAHRLEVINEAELTIRACAYGCGHDAPISYCSEELRMQQVQLHFFSLQKQLLVYGQDFIHLVEPEARAAIDLEQEQSFVQLKQLFEEANRRQQILAWEHSDRNTITKISNRFVDEQREFEALLYVPPAPPTPSDLVRFLGAPPAPTADAVRRSRETLRQSIGELMADVYWQTDELFFAESVTRQLMMESLFSDHEQRGGIIVEVHGVFFPQSIDGREPAFITMWHANDIRQHASQLALRQHVSVGGSQLTFSTPISPLACLVESAAALEGMFFFSVADRDGYILNCTGYLIPGDSANKGFLTVPLSDGSTGRLRLIFHNV